MAETCTHQRQAGRTLSREPYHLTPLMYRVCLDCGVTILPAETDHPNSLLGRLMGWCFGGVAHHG